MKHRVLRRLACSAAVALAVLLVTPPRSPATAVSSSLLSASFHEVAAQGFGDYQNSWPWGSAWYNGRVYIGTNRNVACTMAVGTGSYPPPDPDLHCPGTPPTIAALPSTLGAQIWSVDPNTTQPLTQSNWTENYVSPLTVPITVGRTLTTGPRDVGFRGMSAYTEQDGTQALYVSGVSIKEFAGTAAPPPSLLRSTDGATFQAVPADPGTTLGDINILTTTATSPCCMRGQATFKGYFYITIVDGVGSGTLFATTTPQLGDNSFQQITPSSMPIYEIQPFNGHLYLGVASPNGYSVWRTDCTAPPPGQTSCPPSAFVQVIPPGAGLPQSFNNSVTSMAVFTDTPAAGGMAHLYIGAASEVKTNPAAAEMTRINQDDSWDLIVGTPRTVNGVAKNPLSGYGPGFGWGFNLHMWRMVVHQGILYVGTYDASTSTLKGTSQQAQYQQFLGFDLFASADGVTFTPVTVNGFGDMFSEGVRALVSTPYGLFVGAANHWYGLRVWQGAPPTLALRQAPHDLQGEATRGGPVALAWQAPPHAALFHVYRAAVRPAAVALPGGTRGARPRVLWLPDGYHEVGVTRVPVFVDRPLPAGEHASYYVVAQAADGRLSAPSALVPVPALLPAPTFRDATALLARLGAGGGLAALPRQALHQAAARLRAGDIAGSQTALASLSRALVAGARGLPDGESAVALARVLSRLAAREALLSPRLGLALWNAPLAGGSALPRSPALQPAPRQSP